MSSRMILSEGPPVLVDPTELRADGANFDARTVNSNYPDHQDVLIVGGVNLPATPRINPISGSGGRHVVIMSVDMNGRECAWHGASGTVHMEGNTWANVDDATTPEGDAFTAGNCKKWVVQNCYVPRGKGTDLNWRVAGSSGPGNAAQVVSVTNLGNKTFRMVTAAPPPVASAVGRKIKVAGSMLNGQTRTIQDRNWVYTITGIDATGTIYDLKLYDLADEYFVDPAPSLVATGGTVWFYALRKGSHSDTGQNEDGQFVQYIVFDHIFAKGNYQYGMRVGQDPSPQGVYIRNSQFEPHLDIEPQEVNTQAFFAADDANVVFQGEVWIQPRFDRNAKFASIYPNKNTVNTTLEDGTPALTFEGGPYSGVVRVGKPSVALVNKDLLGPGYAPLRWSGYVVPDANSIKSITVSNLSLPSTTAAGTVVGLCDIAYTANTMGEVVDITLLSDTTGRLQKASGSKELKLSGPPVEGDFTLRATFRRNGVFLDRVFRLKVT